MSRGRNASLSSARGREPRAVPAARAPTMTGTATLVASSATRARSSTVAAANARRRDTLCFRNQ